MAITHICLACGTDLARTRAVLDRAYDFWVVTCPQCRAAAVRKPNAIKRIWFRTLRLDIALSIIVVQIVIGTALLLAARGILDVLVDALRAGRPLDAVRMDLSPVLLAAVVLAMLTGIWLTAGFSHIKRWRLWIGWPIVLLASIAILPMGFVQVFDAKTFFHYVFLFMCTLIPFMLVAALGIPMGHGLLWLHGRFRSARWRYRRRRERRMRGVI